MLNSGVYRIVNLLTGSCYVGSSIRLRSRFANHFRDLELGTHHSIALMRAWRKYGPDCFRFEVLMYCAPEHVLFYEQRFIDSLDSKYNICPVAGNCTGRKLNPEQLMRHAARMRQIVRGPEVYQKVAAALRGKPLSEDHRDKLKVAAKARAVNRVGVPLSEETRRRMSEAGPARMAAITAEHSAKLEAARRRRAKISADQVPTIRKLRREGVSQQKVADMYNVGYWVINAIMSGKSFAYVPD